MEFARERLLLVVALSLAVFVVHLAIDDEGLQRLGRLDDEVAQMQTENARLRGEIEALRRKAAALRDDPRSLERAARERGYVRPDEFLFELR